MQRLPVTPDPSGTADERYVGVDEPRHHCGMPQSIALPDGSGEVELPETPDGYISRIVCRHSDGSVRWEVAPPDGPADSWVAVEVLPAIVVARSWSCWSIDIDWSSGKEVSRRFTK